MLPFDEAAIARAAALFLRGSRSRCRPRRSTASPPMPPIARSGGANLCRQGPPGFQSADRPCARPGGGRAAWACSTMKRGRWPAYWPGPLTHRGAGAAGQWDRRAGHRRACRRRATRPAHPAMQALLAATGSPPRRASANASGRISPTRAAHVLPALTGGSRLSSTAARPTAGSNRPSSRRRATDFDCSGADRSKWMLRLHRARSRHPA